MQTPPFAKKKKKMRGANFCRFYMNKVKMSTEPVFFNAIK